MSYTANIEPTLRTTTCDGKWPENTITHEMLCSQFCKDALANLLWQVFSQVLLPT